MEGIRSYLLSVILVAVICSLLPELLRQGSAGRLVKTACGLVLTVTVLKPLGSISLDFSGNIPSFQDSAVFAAEEGENLAADAMREVIKAHSEAYILDKAAHWEADIHVEIELSQEPPYTPVAVRVSGAASPQARSSLEELLADEFQIPKEAQKWTP